MWKGVIPPKKKRGGGGGKGIRRTDQLADEKTDPDPDGGNEIPLMLLGRQHEDGEAQLGGQQHLDDDALRDRRAGR